MSRLQLIEKALDSINDTVFQELCDAFLLLRNDNYRAFSRSGAATGQQKVVKGTPDSFFLLPNGKFLFIETSTQKKGLFKKLEGDIKKCLDEAKTGVLNSSIQEIALCFNSKLSAAEIEKLKNLTYKKRISLRFYDINELAIEINFHHKDLAYQYLNIPLDSGQIVSIDRFINEYGRAAHGIATPLDNSFVGRDEHRLVISLLDESSLIILTGAAGVGKTRLAIEAINDYLNLNPEYEAYGVSYKNADLLDDLYSYLDESKNYLLFVDDANRVDAFAQIMGFYKTTRRGSLKIILTVRDYAFDELKMQCFGYDYKYLSIPKLTDEKIIEIIKEAPFNLKWAKVHNEIVRIADGNPRIAIMAAKLAIEKQDLNALRDTTALFDKYFNTFMNDNKHLLNVNSIKYLGIISFFYSMPYKNRDEIDFILKAFQLDYEEFIATLDKLEKAELIELKHDYVRIPEQNLSTYFFFKNFIETDKLSFEVLLYNFFARNKDRFKDTVIAANNFFGPEKVMSVLRPSLKKYLLSVKDNKEQTFEVLSSFWFYLQDEVVEFVYEVTVQLPEPNNPEYGTHYEMNDYAYHKDEHLHLLSNLYYHSPDKLKPILELSFEYTRKLPIHLPELVKNIREHLSFDEEDSYSKYARQSSLFDVLYAGVSHGEAHLVQAFYALAGSFLRFEFEHVGPSRRNAISFHHYRLPLTNEIKEFRKLVWKTVASNFTFYPQESRELLAKYGSAHPDVSKEIMDFDAAFAAKIIKRNFKKSKFEDCYIAQEFARWLKRNKIKHADLDYIKETYVNKIYYLFINLSWDRFRDKESFEYKGHDEYDKLKEKSVRKFTRISTIADFKRFYKDVIYLYRWRQKRNHDEISRSLGIILDEIAAQDCSIGYKVLKFIIDNNNEAHVNPYLVFNRLLSDPKGTKRIWEIINERAFDQQAEWQQMYFLCIPENLVTDELCEKLLYSIQQIKEYCDVRFNYFDKYELHNPGLFERILRVIVNKNDHENVRIFIGYNFFQEKGRFLIDVKLMKKAYLQQDGLHKGLSGFDYDGKDLLVLLSRDRSFLLEYLKTLLSKKKHFKSHELQKLAIVWKVEGIEDVMIEVMKEVSTRPFYRLIEKSFWNNFFDGLQQGEGEKADSFIRHFVSKENKNPKCMNVIFDVILHSRKHLFEECFSQYLLLNTDPESFKEIRWVTNGGIHSAEINMGDVKAAEWRRIMNLVEKANLGIKSIPIKAQVSREIENQRNWADYVRKEKFTNPNW